MAILVLLEMIQHLSSKIEDKEDRKIVQEDDDLYNGFKYQEKDNIRIKEISGPRRQQGGLEIDITVQ